MAEKTRTRCAVCSKPGKFPCLTCSSNVFCSSEHRSQRGGHRCWPFRIQGDSNSPKGEVWIALRDFKSGETVIDESPAFYGPLASKSHHVCISCCQELHLDPVPLCSKCARPVCGIDCETNPVHSKNECSLFAIDHQRNSPLLPKLDYLYTERHKIAMYTVMIRAARLKHSDKKVHNKLIQLRYTHSDANLQVAMEEEAKEWLTSFKSLIAPNKLPYFDAAYARQYFIYCMNAFKHNHELESQYSLVGRFPENSDYNINSIHRFFAVYFKASRINHSCKPNCTWTICPEQGFKIRIRAAVPIKKGDELTICCSALRRYLQLGTFERQNILHSVYGIHCNCIRCESSRELDLFSSAIKCNSVSCIQNRYSCQPFGLLLPRRALDLSEEARWDCMLCKHEVKQKDIRLMVDQFRSLLNDFVGQLDDSKVLELGFNGTIYVAQELHPNHGLLVEVTEIIVKQLKEAFPVDESSITVPHLRNYTLWLLFLLGLQDIMCPGLSASRAYILYLLCSAIRVKLQHGFSLSKDEGTIDYVTFIELSKEAMEYYMEAFCLPGESYNVYAQNLFMDMKAIKEKWKDEIPNQTFQNEEIKKFLNVVDIAEDVQELKILRSIQ